MIKMKKYIKKLQLRRDTIAILNTELGKIAGGVALITVTTTAKSADTWCASACDGPGPC